ncbi:MAG: hypothetical protein HQ592_09445 [Planctomycetes bacterium]|nr:hypothetical protein [Planctomycetota bacterium]
MKKTKRRTLAAVAVIAILAVALCAVQYVFRAGGVPRDIRKLIAKYETAPDSETADELGRILSEGDVPDKVGSRVLKALMQPTLHTREAYPLGSRPVLTVSFPNQARFSPAEFTLQAVLRDYDDPAGRYGKGGFNMDSVDRLDSRYEMTCQPYPLGRHDFDLRVECSVRPREWRTIWRWPSLRNFPHRLLPKKRRWTMSSSLLQDKRYQCTLELPVQLNIVPLGSETKVNIVSGEELDGKMKAAFTSILDPAKKTSAQYADENGIVKASATGGIEIFYFSLPEHYAFKAIYRDGITGVEYPLSFHTVILKGGSGEFNVHTSSARLPKPGTYTGMIILTPDLSRISHYPEIAQMWGGHPQFPITFQWQWTVDPGPGNDLEKVASLIRTIGHAKDLAGVPFLASKLDDRRVIGNSSECGDVLVCDIAASALQRILEINFRRVKPIYYVGTRKERDEGIAVWKELWAANKDVPPDKWQHGE